MDFMIGFRMWRAAGMSTLALAVFIHLIACGMTGGGIAVVVPQPPFSQINMEYQTINSFGAFSQYLRITRSDNTVHDYYLRTSAGGGIQLNFYLMPADSDGGPYFRCEERYGHYLVDLSTGDCFVIDNITRQANGIPVNTFHQMSMDDSYSTSTAVDTPVNVRLTSIRGVPMGQPVAEDNVSAQYQGSGLTVATAQVYGGSYYGRIDGTGFASPAAAPEQRIATISGFDPLEAFSAQEKPFREFPLALLGYDSTVFFAHEVGLSPGSSYAYGLRVRNQQADRYFSGRVFDRGNGFNLYSYPAANDHGPLLRLLGTTEVLIDLDKGIIYQMARVDGQVLYGEARGHGGGIRWYDSTVVVTIGNAIAKPAPSDVAAGPGQFLGWIDDTNDPVYVPGGTERTLRKPNIYFGDWPYDPPGQSSRPQRSRR